MSSLRRWGARYQGSLDAAYLGLDDNKEQFHRAAKWEAGKTLIVCVIIVAIVIATQDRDWVQANLPLLVGSCVLVPAVTYYWQRYMVLEWRHDRMRATCEAIHDTESEVAACMRKKAIEEQQLRQMVGGGGGTNNPLLTGGLIGLDIMRALRD